MRYSYVRHNKSIVEMEKVLESTIGIKLLILLTFLLSASCGKKNHNQRDCVQHSFKEYNKAVSQMFLEDETLDETKVNLTALVMVLDELNLKNCPSDYKYQFLKIKEEYHSFLKIIKSADYARGETEVLIESMEVANRVDSTSDKLKELAENYGVKIE